MLFSAVAVNPEQGGLHFHYRPAVPPDGAAVGFRRYLRVPYSFVIPLFGGRRWTAISTCFLLVPCLWLGFAVQDSSTPYSVFVIIPCCAASPAPTLPPAWPTSASSSRKRVRAVRWELNGGLGNLGVSVMQLVAPLAIFQPVRPVWRYGAKSGSGANCGWKTPPGSGCRSCWWPRWRPGSA